MLLCLLFSLDLPVARKCFTYLCVFFFPVLTLLAATFYRKGILPVVQDYAFSFLPICIFFPEMLG